MCITSFRQGHPSRNENETESWEVQRSHGAMAQLVAHLLCKQGVRGSSPRGSTRRKRRRPPTGARPAVGFGPGCSRLPCPGRGDPSACARRVALRRGLSDRMRAVASLVSPAPAAPRTGREADAARDGTAPVLGTWGSGAAGSAPAWHAGGRGFESLLLHPSAGLHGRAVRPRRRPRAVVGGSAQHHGTPQRTAIHSPVEPVQSGHGGIHPFAAGRRSRLEVQG